MVGHCWLSIAYTMVVNFCGEKYPKNWKPEKSISKPISEKDNLDWGPIWNSKTWTFCQAHWTWQIYDKQAWGARAGRARDSLEDTWYRPSLVTGPSLKSRLTNVLSFVVFTKLLLNFLLKLIKKLIISQIQILELRKSCHILLPTYKWETHSVQLRQTNKDVR